MEIYTKKSWKFILTLIARPRRRDGNTVWEDDLLDYNVAHHLDSGRTGKSFSTPQFTQCDLRGPQQIRGQDYDQI